MVEYQRTRCFAVFADAVSILRRAADEDENRKILANTEKGVGNQGYGGLAMNKTKHTDTKYYTGHINATQAVHQPSFRKLTCLNEEEEYYEEEFAESSIKLDIPIHLALFVLNLAKKRLLEFHYECIDRYLDRTDYQLLEMDTDSSYLALSKHSLEELVKPELADEYKESRRGKSVCTDTPLPPHPIFFQRECCKKHEAWDKRTPGLFKIEFLAEDMYSLSSKSRKENPKKLFSRATKTRPNLVATASTRGSFKIP